MLLSWPFLVGQAAMPRCAVKLDFGANGRFRFISSAAIVAVMASSGSAVAANIVANGNFASGLSDWTTSWNVSGAAAITYAGTNWGDPNEDFPSYNGGPEVGEGCGDTWSCTLSQTLTTTPGQTYTLSFAFNPGNCVGTYPPQCNGADGYVYLYGHQNFPGIGPLQGGNLTVEVGDNQVASITNVTNGNQAWTVYQYLFTATSTSTVLSFRGWQGPDVNALAAVSVTAGGPTVNVQATPSGPDFSYGFSLSNLSGKGDVFIPIMDPSALVITSLPQGSTLIEDPATIASDWPGALPVSMNVFDDPVALLEIPENGETSLTFSFLDRNAPIDGPLFANGIMIDPQIPGLPVPEPSTWAMMFLGFAGLGFAGYRASRRSVALAV